MSELDPKFEHTLRQAFINRPPESCPTDEQLVSYYEGRLSTDERAVLGAHLEHCGLCDALLLRLQRPDLGALPTSEVEKRLRKRLGARPRIWEKIRNVFGSRGFAYFLAASVTLILLVRVGYRDPLPEASWREVEELDLSQSRNAQSEPPNAVTARGEGQLLLKFFIPVDPSKEYWLSLDGGTARRCRSFDELGNFKVVIATDSMSKGVHRLGVEERELSRVERSWSFEFSTK